MARCDTYTPGQCTAGACELNPWIPEGLGNGGSWADNARADGLEVTMTPTVGAVVCYCSGDGYSEFGHVASVLAVHPDGSFDVREENYIGPFQWDTRTSSSADVCGFILPPGTSPGAGAVTGSGAGASTPAELGHAWGRIQDLFYGQFLGRFNRWSQVGATAQHLYGP